VSGIVYKSAGRPAVIDRAVYGTIVVTSVLVVYDGWAHLKLSDAVAIILGPVVAMVIGHVFAASLSAYPKLGRRPTRRELLGVVRRESRFLLVCVPQIVLLVVLTVAGLRLNTTVRVLIWASAASLGFWGGVAARRAGVPGRGIALGVITGLAARGAVLLLQVFLQPDQAVSNGVAVIQFLQGPVGRRRLIGDMPNSTAPRMVEEAHLPGTETILAATHVTIRLSVIAHGITAAPLASRYARWYESHPVTTPRRWKASLRQVTARARRPVPTLRRRHERRARWSAPGATRPPPRAPAPRDRARAGSQTPAASRTCRGSHDRQPAQRLLPVRDRRNIDHQHEPDFRTIVRSARSTRRRWSPHGHERLTKGWLSVRRQRQHPMCASRRYGVAQRERSARRSAGHRVRLLRVSASLACPTPVSLRSRRWS
jgi:hypothetical protein